jgi:hypothetical protein
LWTRASLADNVFALKYETSWSKLLPQRVEYRNKIQSLTLPHSDSDDATPTMAISLEQLEAYMLPGLHYLQYWRMDQMACPDSEQFDSWKSANNFSFGL